LRLSARLPSRSYAEEVLNECATILVKTGHSPKELVRTLRQICRALDEPPRPFDPGAIAYVVGLSHVVAHWYSDPAFRDKRNQPLRLPLQGPDPCLAKLVHRVFPLQDVKTVAASLGIDFARYGMDEPIEAVSTQAIRSNVEAITASLGPGWSKRRLIDRFVLGSRQPPIVGAPEQVADQLIAWVREADVDGFNLSRTVVPSVWRVSSTW